MDFNFKNKYIPITIVCAVVLIVVFYTGFFAGTEKALYVINADKTDTTAVTQEQFAPFWKVWNILDQKYVKSASSTAQDKIWGAIQGLAASYGDPYTVFFPPTQSKMFQDDITGNFGGVGMEIGIKNNQLVVVAPLKDSPASKAGVKAGDAILKIEATSTQGMPVDKAVNLIRGPKGSPVNITFLSAGSSAPVVKKIVRDTINIPTLDTETRAGGISVIRLYSFTAQSPDLFRNALREFVMSGNHKLILDLRGNPGGYLDAAWDMASYFLPAGKVVVTEDFGTKGAPNVFRSKGYNIFDKNLKMLILVDGGSASASEILAGALTEQGVAKLVGSKTFGKGVVQELIPITADTSLKVTVARWMTPKGHNLSENGLDPDYAVSAASSTPENDIVMNKAIQLLNQQP
ncbi:MAG TPA: S41 family peptidase [Candidatus Paceibacterota bacterium]|jgi:carboxyl-terminal processing protease|nr:S41 family peptidase [Candidatus Paceibacterota bacterium]